ncbi:MAG: DUF2141 domain-containing protein [Sphingomonadaceae bacterium]|nr:DUF2141 domain-containing protein [Sphingomonadaceae bacterium]
MSKFLSAGILAAAIAAAAPAAAQPPLGADAAVCRAGHPSILVNVLGFNQRTGNVRVALYDNPATFLQRGATVRKINLPVTPGGPMRICIAVPHPGRYAVGVRHDVNGDNARGDWSDGAGFSHNPRISLLHLRPSFDQVAVNVGQGVLGVNVVLNYRFGLSIHPVGG